MNRKEKRPLLPGERFGYLTVVSACPERTKSGQIKYRCECTCGNHVDVVKYNLLNGTSKSCGCYRKKRCAETHTTHGLSHTRLKKIYGNMKDRCYNKNMPAYKNYGGRGIKICDEWLEDFVRFYNWAISNGYSDDLTIERIDVNGDYSPSNCTWIPLAEQAKNRRYKQYELDGESHTLSQWAEIYGIKKSTLEKRLRIGWNIRDAITKPIRKY